MTPVRWGVALGLLVGSVAALAVALTGGSTVVLGHPWAPGLRGYGAVRPATIFDGYRTNLVDGIKWESWGGTRAEGAGFAYYTAPGQAATEATREPARVVAFKLGRCGGSRAYEAVHWYFPQHGQRFDAGTYKHACDAYWSVVIRG
jgi:hypothetical protein